MLQPQCTLSPSMGAQFFRTGVEGGMEERRVSLAMGNAGRSSNKAVESVFGDASKSYREWKRLKGGKSTLASSLLINVDNAHCVNIMCIWKHLDIINVFYYSEK